MVSPLHTSPPTIPTQRPWPWVHVTPADHARLHRHAAPQTLGRLRFRFARALRKAGYKTAVINRAARCGTTGHFAWSMHDGAPILRYRPHYCGHRACPDPACQQQRLRDLRAHTERLAAEDIDNGRRVSFITLTFPGDDGMAYAAARDRLWKAWARLRRSPAWRGRMRDAGGLASEEATWRKDGAGHYHTHIHTLVGGAGYWPSTRREKGQKPADHNCRNQLCDGGRHLPRDQRHEPRKDCPDCLCLSCAWREATHGLAYIVDVRRAYDPRDEAAPARQAAIEAVKYAAKSWTLPQAQWPDWVEGLRGRRTRRVWGRWYNVPRPASPTAGDAPVRVSTLERDATLADLKDAVAVLAPPSWAPYIGHQGTGWRIVESIPGGPPAIQSCGEHAELALARASHLRADYEDRRAAAAALATRKSRSAVWRFLRAAARGDRDAAAELGGPGAPRGPTH